MIKTLPLALTTTTRPQPPSLRIHQGCQFLPGCTCLCETQAAGTCVRGPGWQGLRGSDGHTHTHTPSSRQRGGGSLCQTKGPPSSSRGQDRTPARVGRGGGRAVGAVAGPEGAAEREGMRAQVAWKQRPHGAHGGSRMKGRKAGSQGPRGARLMGGQGQGRGREWSHWRLAG